MGPGSTGNCRHRRRSSWSDRLLTKDFRSYSARPTGRRSLMFPVKRARRWGKASAFQSTRRSAPSCPLLPYVSRGTLTWERNCRRSHAVAVNPRVVRRRCDVEFHGKHWSLLRWSSHLSCAACVQQISFVDGTSPRGNQLRPLGAWWGVCLHERATCRKDRMFNVKPLRASFRLPEDGNVLRP